VLAVAMLLAALLIFLAGQAFAVLPGDDPLPRSAR
jgi:hypothetical protein